MLLLSPVTRLMPSFYNLSKSPWDIYPIISKQLAEEVVTEPVEHSFVPIIHIRLGEHEVDQLSTLVASQMQFEAEIPSHRTFPY